jgi:hypothetical protein
MRSRVVLGRVALCVSGGVMALTLPPGKAVNAQPPPPRVVARYARPLVLGDAAFVVSEVTVKKIVDTRELDRIKEVLANVDASQYRLDVVQARQGAAPAKTTVGRLPMTDLVMVDRAAVARPGGQAAFVVSEVTVKKVTDTRELDRIRDVLRGVDAAAYQIRGLRVETIQ